MGKGETGVAPAASPRQSSGRSPDETRPAGSQQQPQQQGAKAVAGQQAASQRKGRGQPKQSPLRPQGREAQGREAGHPSNGARHANKRSQQAPSAGHDQVRCKCSPLATSQTWRLSITLMLLSAALSSTCLRHAGR